MLKNKKGFVTNVGLIIIIILDHVKDLKLGLHLQ